MKNVINKIFVSVVVLGSLSMATMAHARHVTVKASAGTTYNFNIVDNDLTVDWLKHHIATKQAAPPMQQTLIYAGKILDDNKKLTEVFGSQNDVTVHLVLKSESPSVESAAQRSHLDSKSREDALHEDSWDKDGDESRQDQGTSSLRGNAKYICGGVFLVAVLAVLGYFLSGKKNDKPTYKKT